MKEKQIEATKENKALMRQHSERIDIPVLMEWIGNFNDAINDLRTSWQPSLALEIAFAKSINSFHGETRIEKKVEIPVHLDNEKTVERKIVDLPRKVTEPVKEKPVIEEKPVAEKVVSAAVSAPGESISTQEILSAWNQIRAEVKQRRPQTEALLNSQRLVQVKHGVLILGFPSDVLRSKMENSENIEVTQRVIKGILNKDIPIECIVVGDKAGSSTLDTDVDPDGLVRTALNLGGKLVQKD